MKKRIIGIFLAVAMLVPAVFTVSASAASQSELPQALLLYTGFTRNDGKGKYSTLLSLVITRRRCCPRLPGGCARSWRG